MKGIEPNKFFLAASSGLGTRLRLGPKPRVLCMNMNRYIFLLLFILVGCQEDKSSIVYNPTPKDVAGVWESLSLYQYYPFAVVNLKVNGNGNVVLVSKDNEVLKAHLSNFVSQPESFFITLKGQDEDDEPEQWVGSLKRGQLCFYMYKESEDDRLNACFTKASEVNGYRALAYKELGLE